MIGLVFGGEVAGGVCGNVDEANGGCGVGSVGLGGGGGDGAVVGAVCGEGAGGDVDGVAAYGERDGVPGGARAGEWGEDQQSIGGWVAVSFWGNDGGFVAERGVGLVCDGGTALVAGGVPEPCPGGGSSDFGVGVGSEGVGAVRDGDGPGALGVRGCGGAFPVAGGVGGGGAHGVGSVGGDVGEGDGDGVSGCAQAVDFHVRGDDPRGRRGEDFIRGVGGESEDGVRERRVEGAVVGVVHRSELQVWFLRGVECLGDEGADVVVGVVGGIGCGEGVHVAVVFGAVTTGWFP